MTFYLLHCTASPLHAKDFDLKVSGFHLFDNALFHHPHHHHRHHHHHGQALQQHGAAVGGKKMMMWEFRHAKEAVCINQHFSLVDHEHWSQSSLQLKTGVYVTLWNDRRKHECSRSRIQCQYSDRRLWFLFLIITINVADLEDFRGAFATTCMGSTAWQS